MFETTDIRNTPLNLANYFYQSIQPIIMELNIIKVSLMKKYNPNFNPTLIKQNPVFF